MDFLKAEEIIVSYTQCRNNENIYPKQRTCSTGVVVCSEFYHVTLEMLLTLKRSLCTFSH